jgi:aconitase A
MKKELSDWYKAMGFGKLNAGCSTCIRNAMGKLLKSINDGEQLKPRIHFIGIKQ